MNSSLRIFSSLKTAVSSNLGPRFGKLINGIRVGPLNKACTTQNNLQLLLKDLGMVLLGLQDIKLQSRVPEVKP
jgi:predicted Kef-type K+ transport protein